VESHTRRRLKDALIACVLAAACGAHVAYASAGPPEQSGVFALLGGTPKIVSKFWADHAAGLTATLKIRQFQLDGTAPILAYDVDMERLIHVIVVRDDFATFAHLHPAFDTTSGTFSQRFTKAPNHRYYVYADSNPRGIGQQVFRFTMESDGAVANSQPSVTASAPAAQAGPYTVTVVQTTVPANMAHNLKVAISEGGRPAHGLGTYLGAAAHAVFINTSTLAYVHLHPTVVGAASTMTSMAMGMGTPAGPLMQMRLPPLPGGTYKLWLQFRGANGVVYTAAFTLLAR
jgi:hypothetical protein